jgi:hypothetical protein
MWTVASPQLMALRSDCFSFQFGERRLLVNVTAQVSAGTGRELKRSIVVLSKQVEFMNMKEASEYAWSNMSPSEKWISGKLDQRSG